MKLMKRPLQLIRLLHINIIILRNRLDTIALSTQVLQPFKFLRYFNPWYWLTRETLPRGVSIRIALEQLGPVFVKFGQILSTRRDILPDDIADELEKLQDRVPPFPGELAKKIIEQKFNKPVEDIFSSFEVVPLASASIAQVHAAQLQDGRKVVVKILRPNIEKIIRRDIGLLYSVAKLTEYFLPHGKKLHLREIVAEFERSITYELDLLHEGANASQLRRNFINSNLLYVPEVFWDFSNKDILVMERVDGIPISDIETLKQSGINLKQLAENGVEIFFTQVFRDSFFHADMHPGNIFVSKENPQLAKYIAVDFGIMGMLSPIDQHYLAQNLLAFFRRDYRRVAELHIKSGWVSTKVRIDEFETAIRGVSEPIFERPLKDISFGKLLVKVFEAAREFHMEVQPQFFLLQKTLLNIEGLGRQLYPELDLWATAKPYVERWVKKQLSPITMLNKVYQNMPNWIDRMIELPELAHSSLSNKAAQQQAEMNHNQIKKYATGKWLGLGFGLLITAIINYILMLTLQIKPIVNIVLGAVGLLIIVVSLIRI